MKDADQETNPFRRWINVAQPRLGARVVACTDEFFGAASRMLDPAEPVFIPDKFDDHGKWMDGWETRRRRGPGHDHAVVRLGAPARIHGVDIDTRHFTGNYPPSASIEACAFDGDTPEATVEWQAILETVTLHGNSHHYVPVEDSGRYTHVRIHIFPDGGIARLRVYGEVLPDWSRIDVAQPVDLLAMENGGRAIACSDEHFGSMHNLNAPGRGIDMGDGWETRRRRTPGNDWVIHALGHPGVIERIEVDTAHFKGNYPDRVSLQGARVTARDTDSIVAESQFWATLLPEMKTGMDRVHQFDAELYDLGPVTHVRFNIFPDGGVSRLRLFGHPAP